jgi:hypothetical protein
MSGAHAVGLASIGGFGSVELAVLIVVASVYAVVPAGLIYLSISREDERTASGTERTEDEGGVSEEGGGRSG